MEFRVNEFTDSTQPKGAIQEVPLQTSLQGLSVARGLFNGMRFKIPTTESKQTTNTRIVPLLPLGVNDHMMICNMPSSVWRFSDGPLFPATQQTTPT